LAVLLRQDGGFTSRQGPTIDRRKPNTVLDTFNPLGHL